MKSQCPVKGWQSWIPGAAAVAPARADPGHLALPALASAGAEEDALTKEAGIALATREDTGLLISAGDILDIEWYIYMDLHTHTVCVCGFLIYIYICECMYTHGNILYHL
jgi:hypothetical protein